MDTNGYIVYWSKLGLEMKKCYYNKKAMYTLAYSNRRSVSYRSRAQQISSHSQNCPILTLNISSKFSITHMDDT